MRHLRSLRARLIASYLLVVAAVGAAGFLTVRLLTPVIFENRLQARRGPSGAAGTGAGRGAAEVLPSESIEHTYENALTLALVIATAVGLVVAIVLAFIVARRLLRRLRDVRDAAGRLAAGDYDSPIDLPPETELADLATSMNVLGATLASTDRARARLVSDLAHELRNPLGTIEGYMEGMMDGVVPATDETFQTVADEAHRLSRLTQDLSLLARAQEGALEMQRQPADVARITRKVVDHLRPQFDSKKVRITTEIDDPLDVWGDEDRLTQAITNVVGNALTHTPEGGSVQVAGAIKGRVCRITVTDSGEGIPADKIDTIFSRYTRFHDGPGTGIGLNIARSLARGHGGDLTAESKGEGKGAKFTLTLPRRAEG